VSVPSVPKHKDANYPAGENVEWYKRNCNPKLKIKAMADGGLLYPCENHSGTIGSLVDHSIRDLWTKDLESFPNASCIGCGKQRFRLHAFRRLDRQALFLWKKWRGTLDWSWTTVPIFPAATAAAAVIRLHAPSRLQRYGTPGPVQGEPSCGNSRPGRHDEGGGVVTVG
jgi:hypothetical protein